MGAFLALYPTYLWWPVAFEGEPSLSGSFMGKIWIGMHSFLGSFLELFDRPRHRIYFDGKSDGFGELLPDMIERDPSLSLAMGSA